MHSNIELNSESFESLFREHYDGLGRYAFTLVKNQSISEDIVQRLFVNLWEKRTELNIQEIKAYLYRSVHNFSMNELKKMKRSYLHEDIETTNDIKTSVSPSDFVHQEELEDKIEMAIQSLPEKCGEVFRMSRIQELSYKEIAERLEISVKTVENHMGKALRLMRLELSEYLSELFLILLFFKGW